MLICIVPCPKLCAKTLSRTPRNWPEESRDIWSNSLTMAQSCYIQEIPTFSFWQCCILFVDTTFLHNLIFLDIFFDNFIHLYIVFFIIFTYPIKLSFPLYSHWIISSYNNILFLCVWWSTKFIQDYLQKYGWGRYFLEHGNLSRGYTTEENKSR